MPSDQTVLELEPFPGEPGKAVAVVKPTLRELAIAKFGNWRPQAQALVDELKAATFDLTTPKGRKALTEAIAKVRAPRYAAQHAVDDGKAELKSVGVDMVNECEAVTAFLAETEKRLVDLKTAHDTAEAERKRIADEQAAARKATFDQRITEIRGCADRAKDYPSDRIGNGIAMLAALPMSEAEWAEFLPQAIKARDETMQAMRELLAKATECEELAERARKAEEENAALRAQLAISNAQRPLIITPEPAPGINRLIDVITSTAEDAAVNINDPALAAHPVAQANAESWNISTKLAREPAPDPAIYRDPVAMAETSATLPPDPALAPTLKIGELNDRLQHIKVSAEGLLALGFKRADRPGPACHYLASEWPAIKAALIKHLQGLQ